MTPKSGISGLRVIPVEGDDVQKKTCALAGLAVAAAGGVLISGSPAYAGALVQGHRHHHYRHSSYSRNTNLNRNHNRVVVRVNVRNRNVNTSFVDRDRDRDFDEGAGFFRRCHFGCNRFNRFDDFEGDRFDRDNEDRGDKIIVGNDIRTAGDRD